MACLFFDTSLIATSGQRPRRSLDLIVLDGANGEMPETPKTRTRLTTPSWTTAAAAKSSA